MRLPLTLLLLMPAVMPAQNSTWKYPDAPRGDVVDDYHGHKVPDPYRWLEELDSPQTQGWVKAENELTFGFLEKLPQRAAYRERLTQLWNYPRYGLPRHEGGHYFFSKNDGLQNQSVYYVQEGLHGTPRILLDPNTLAVDGTVALTVAEVSNDGKLLAYGTAAAGSDWNEFRVRDVATGKDTGDLVKWVKFSGLAWTRDSRGFFYSRFPDGVDETGKTFSALEHQRVFYHTVGTPQGSDKLIYEVAAEPKWLLGAEVTEDGRYLVITTQRGDSHFNLVRVTDLLDPKSPHFDGPTKMLVGAWEAEYQFLGNSGPRLYFHSNLGAPRRSVVAADFSSGDSPKFATVVPESQDAISSAAIIGGKLVLVTLHDAVNRLVTFDLNGKSRGEIPLPGLGTVSGLAGREDETEMFYSFVSYIAPATIFRCDVSTAANAVFRSPELAADLSGYVSEEIFYASKDGTKIPMILTHRRGAKLDGSNPTILYGYGGFDISLTPSFSVTTLAWLEKGGIFAVPNLRGGGEYGKAWHDAGTKERKQNVFDDFIAAAEWLFKNKYTSPQHLVLSGGSNGGLLVGAVVNQRPDLCRVAWPAVGVMDMLRFHKFTIGFAWVADYGSSDDEAGFGYLSKYSPLHTVKSGAKYPAILVTTADHDDRVFPAHSFKYTATLQKAVADHAGSGPVLIRIETRAGHGAGKPTAKIIEEAADKLAFADYFLNLSAK